MGALLDQFAADGVTIEAAGNGNVRARGLLTDAIRASIREHKAAILDELAANGPAIDPEIERRRAKALSILAERPDRQIAIVAEAGDPAHIAVAIRGSVVGEVTVAAERYDAFALLALMNDCRHA